MRVIIDVHPTIDRVEAMQMVKLVMQQGDISKTNGHPHPCHATLFKNDVLVTCRRNRSGSLKFHLVPSQLDPIDVK